jgi:Methylase involved in ubiquinone/menaquinone biosynthesis
MRNFHKLDMASTDWLTTHFLAKSANRIRDLASLPIATGFKILDLCCGPGLYIPHLLDLVGPTGHVTGLDHDPISLDAAHQRLKAQPHQNWDLRHANLEEQIADLADYDIVLLFNCIGYFPDPFNIISLIARNLRPGAVIIVKDFDLESFFFQPRDTSMWAELIMSAKSKNDGENPISFDNFFGRKVHTLHQVYEFREHTNDTWTQLMTFPFNPFETEYLWRNVECLLNQAGSDCPPHVIDYFKRLFFPPVSEFFSYPDAMFVEVEYVTCLRL